MIDKTKIWGTFYKDSKYCGVKSPTVVKKKLTVLCMHSKTAHREPWLYEDWIILSSKRWSIYKNIFCACLNYVVFLFENIHVFLSKSGERNTDFQFPDFI